MKLKGLSKALMLSVAISSAATGCVTYTPWETVESEYRPTGIEREVVLETTPEKEEEITFDISDPYMGDGEHQIQITESLEEFNSEVRVIGAENQFEKFLVQERETTDRDQMSEITYSSIVAFGALGAAGGALVLGGDPELGFFGGAMIGGSVGVTFGLITGGTYALVTNPKITETRSTRTYETEQRLSSSRTIETVPGENVMIYQDEPASNIIVRLSGEGRHAMHTTGNRGKVYLGGFVESLNPQYFFRNYTDNELQERIGGISLVQQIKPRTLETLMDDLVQAISPKDVRLTVSTQEESSEGREVRNDSRTFNIEGGQITDESIYGIVRQFVDEEINSHIKSLTFVVKDNISHVPIDDSNFEFRLNAPRREDLAGEYFTQNLKDYAERRINNYIEESAIIGGVPSKVLSYIYTPSMIQLEITHPDYHFVNGVVVMENEDLEKTVYMVEKGSMIRVQDADNERGRIE